MIQLYTNFDEETLQSCFIIRENNGFKMKQDKQNMLYKTLIANPAN